jgi:hypothetical protein
MTSNVFNMLQTPEARTAILDKMMQEYLKAGFEAKVAPDALVGGMMISISRAIVTVAASIHASNKNGETIDHITSDMIDFIEDFTYEALSQFKALPPSQVVRSNAPGSNHADG